MKSPTIQQLEHRLRVAKSDLRDCDNPKYPHLNTPELRAAIQVRIENTERALARLREEA
jgi:hypothetical protein